MKIFVFSKGNKGEVLFSCVNEEGADLDGIDEHGYFARFHESI